LLEERLRLSDVLGARRIDDLSAFALTPLEDFLKLSAPVLDDSLLLGWRLVLSRAFPSSLSISKDADLCSVLFVSPVLCSPALIDRFMLSFF
jgi:hypothetical protein